jgi:hypothetical protein
MKIKYLILFFIIFLPSISYGIILDTGVGSNSVWVKTGITAGPSGDYIDAPTPFGDDDYQWACWNTTGNDGECSGFHSHDIGSTPTDGEYEFLDTTTDESFILCILEGVWSIGTCEAPPEPPTPMSTSTASFVDINLAYVIFYQYFKFFFSILMIFVMMFMFRRYIF